MTRLRATIAVVVATLAVTCTAGAATSDDVFLAGYATAILERELGLDDAIVVVRNGVVRLHAPGLAGTDRDEVVAVLSGIPGVRRVEILDEPPVTPPSEANAVAEASPPKRKLLPGGFLFDSLVADPRWPHFSIAYQSALDDDELQNVGATSFGETISLYRDAAPFDGEWEVGLQAGVFAIFDLDAPSSDLINADYLGGIPVAYRVGPFSLLARILHQSSHLGDEFLLRESTDRINLSWEQVDVKASWDILGAVRVYGGGGRLLRRDPASLEPWSTQAGIEIDPPVGLAVRPLFAADVQHREETDWNTDFSLRGGFRIENPAFASRTLILLVEYFDGHSPNGQFFDRSIETIGVGAHLLF